MTVQRLLATLCRPFTKHPAQGAASLVLALTGEEELLAGGDHVYINNCFPTQPSTTASSDEVTRALWDSSLDTIHQLLGHSWMSSTNFSGSFEKL